MERVAVVGCGLVGRAWAMVFARAGMQAALWDPAPGAADQAMARIRGSLADLAEAGLIAEAPDQVAARILPAASLEAAVAGALHVQESGPEVPEVKRATFAELDALCGERTTLASSTSSIPASAFTEALEGRARCLVAHPVNPPYLIPLVELVAAPWTSAEALAQVRALMTRAGQVPVVAHRETTGFVLNRLQWALLAEAFRLVRDGVMSPEDLDACVTHGLGRRWAFMGPFETIDLNAPGGAADYVARFAAPLAAISAEQTAYAYDGPEVAAVHDARRAALPVDQIPERSAWRDRRLMALAAHLKAQEG
jgi:3-hydroxyacyl-CoA dehydrogenase